MLRYVVLQGYFTQNKKNIFTDIFGAFVQAFRIFLLELFAFIAKKK